MSGKSYRKRSSSRRHKKGGAGAANPSSYSDAQSYMKATVGSGDQQYNNVFSSSHSSNSNSGSIVGLQGQKAGSRKRSASRRKRGGLWGQIINQALVPFSILGMQQTYRKRRHGGKKSHKNRRH
uniref:Uncharacterized protein n=1 Tax=viral metagenome TaxID=1070528 RepID=A0A6C0EQQ1_9ZZZZ